MRIFSFWLFSVLVSFGVETVGWRVALGSVVAEGTKNPLVKELDRPPGRSAFFEEGDKLWDLSVVLKLDADLLEPPSDQEDPFAVALKSPSVSSSKRVFGGEWLVWNARSKMIVGRGALGEIAGVDDVIGRRPCRIWTTLDSKSSDGEARTLTVSCESGYLAEARSESLGMHVSVSPTHDLEWVDMYASLDRRSAGGRLDQVWPSALIRVGERVTVARWKEGAEMWELGMKVELKTRDRVALSEVKHRELDGELVAVGNSIRLGDQLLEGATLGDGLVLRHYWVPPDFLRVLQPEAANSELQLKELKIPEELQPLLGGRYWDATELLRAQGVAFAKPSALAAFDPKRSRMLMVNDAVNQDLMKQICSGVDWPGEAPATAQLHFDWGNGSCMVLGQSGSRMGITRWIDGRAKAIEKLEVSPMIAYSSDVVDLRYSLDLGVDLSVSSEVSLEEGETVELGSLWQGGDERRITGRAVLLPYQ